MHLAIRTTRLSVILSALALAPSVVFAADRAKAHGYTYWLDIGLFGKSYSRDVDGYGTLFKVSLSKDGNLVSYRNFYHDNGDSIFACIGDAITLTSCESPSIEILDQALLFGRVLNNKGASFEIGVAKVNGSYTYNPGNDFSATGLAFDVDWRFAASHYGGIGVNISGDINKKQSTIGAFFTFLLGKLD